MKSVLTLSILGSALLLTACDKNTEKKNDASMIKPGQTVQFARGFACVTKDSYKKAAQHSANPEKTGSATVALPPDCVKLPQKIDFRVLSVDQQNNDSLIEVSNSHNVGNSGGIWTTPEFVAPKTSP